jgi:hypothetical protein
MTRKRLPLLLLALAGLLGRGAAAQEPSRLVAADPANRSGEPAVSRLIAQLIAARSASAAVRARAEQAPQWGRLEVGADEILAEIGALDALDAAPPRPAPVRPQQAAPTQPAPVAAEAAPEPVRSVQQAPPWQRQRPLDARNKHDGGGGGGAGGW